MKKDIRILFTDLDGTLLNDQKEITPETQKAIDQALAAGHKIVVTTGRPLASGLTCAEKAGLVKEGCYVIAFNGGQIYDPFHKKTISGKAIPKEIARDIFREAVKRNLYIQSYSDTHVLTLKEGPELTRYVGGTGQPYQVVKTVEEAVPQDPYKILAISLDDRPGEERFRKEVLEPMAGKINGFFSNDAYLEIVPEGISKGFAVRWMCEQLDIPLENSVAAGDAENDVEMLKAAHTGAVMCNAFPGIQEYGDYVTENDNNHDGVGEIIHKFILKDC